MSITGIIFNQKKVVFQNSNSKAAMLSANSGPLPNIANVLQGGLVGQTTGIVIDATLTESHILNSEVTDYPIETGGTVSDHVQLKPKLYNMTGVISDNPIGFLVLGNLGNIINTVQSYVGRGRSQEAYDAIVRLWESRIPFTVTTNLNSYENMLFTSFVVDDDVDTANEINFKASLKQVNIVTSQSIASQGQNLNSSNKIQQTAQSTVNNGTQTTNTTDPGSVLHEGIGTRIGRFFH